MDVVDSRLKSIKPPSFITRVPRAVSTHFKYWKAAELRSWLFCYSVPILMDMMTSPYYYHICAFVEAILLLCTDSVSPSHTDKSEVLLNYFVSLFGTLYGDRYRAVAAMRQARHLPR